MKEKHNANARINVVLFCGGRGSVSIIQELLRRTHIHLTLIVNAYDDGLSTGALRDFISEMLGPSDFRKNLSYLLDPYSKGQYALKNLLEYRLPTTVENYDINHFIEFIKAKKISAALEPLNNLFSELTPALKKSINFYLLSFFDYAASVSKPFDFRDCSVGNLIFAGAYLAHGQDFNVAASKMSALVSSRAVLVNVSDSENRILVGLKEDGELLENEARIVGKQSASPIKNIFLIPSTISASDWQSVAEASIDVKENYLSQREALPSLSLEAAKALAEADIIIYGPGTQHSSLFPSYKIAHDAIRHSPALIKAFVMNLEPDHDIQSLAASDIIDRALHYLRDTDNANRCISHVLIDHNGTEHHLPAGLLHAESYKNTQIIAKDFLSQNNAHVHNGRVVVDTLFSLREKEIISRQNYSGIDIFIDLHNRSCALNTLSQEFLEIDWKNLFSHAALTVNQEMPGSFSLPNGITLHKSDHKGLFSETSFFENWLQHGKSEYLVLLTGDGEYCFRDVLLGINLLEQTQFGAIFGSRNQSRYQFKTSLRAAYQEKRFLRFLSLCGAFLVSAVFSLRFGIILSDPLTGFRIFKHSRLAPLHNKPLTKIQTPISIAKFLLKNKIEIAEFPVNYRIYSGFSDPNWRFRRGLKNLFSVFKWGES